MAFDQQDIYAELAALRKRVEELERKMQRRDDPMLLRATRQARKAQIEQLEREPSDVT